MAMLTDWSFWLTLVVFLALSYFWFTSFRNYRIPKGIPFVRQNGRQKQLALQVADIYKKNQHPIVGIRVFGITPCLIVSDLNLVKSVLVDDFPYFQNRGLFYNEKDDPLSAILGTVDHDLWKLMKRKVAPAFTTAKLQHLFSQLKNVCAELANNLIGSNGEKIVEILDSFSQCATDAVGEIAFGNNRSQLAEKLHEMVGKSKQAYLKFPFNRFVVAFPKFARFLGMRKHSKEVSDFFLKYVTEIVRNRDENDENFNDFMQWLIDAELGIPRIAAIAFDLLSAGYADSTSTLAYCLYELALNEDVQNRARDEVQSILTNQEFTYDALKKMSYLKQIMQETERKYPVAGIAMRVATRDYQVPNTDIIIPDGMKVFIPIYAIHHDEKYYPDPEVFDPDRFTEQSKRQRLKYSFLPFGEGPRKCMGYRFAEMFIGIGLVSLLKTFEFSTCDATQIPLEFNPNKNTLHPKSGVTLKVRRI